MSIAPSLRDTPLQRLLRANTARSHPEALLLNEADRCEDAPSSTDASVLDAAQLTLARDEKQKSAHAASALLLAAPSDSHGAP